MLYRSSPESSLGRNKAKKKRSTKGSPVAKSGKAYLAEAFCLQKMPKDFHWELLTLLSRVLFAQMPNFDAHSAKIFGAIRNRDIRGLDSLALEGVRATADVEKTCIERLLTRFLLKIEDDLPGIEKPDPIKTFLITEERTRETNEKLRQRDTIPEWEGMIRARISYLLGRPPARLDGRHGPGASLGIPRPRALPFHKWQLPMTCSSGALPILLNNVGSDPMLERHFMRWPRGHNPWYSWIGMDHYEDVVPSLVTLCEHNRLTFVPKNWKSFRTIAVEPTANIYLQLAIHDHLSRRLNKYGIYIEDQTVNQKRAREGSRSGKLGTLDLSAASDSVSREAMRILLPKDWFALLDSLRSKSFLNDGKTTDYELFSSMGCGYTFCMMSVLFSAILFVAAWLHGSHKSFFLENCVYGDDLVFPNAHLETTMQMLSYYGFRVNEEKSFFTGPFRESCGKDYYMGFDITPVYLRNLPKNAMDLVKLHNSLFNWFSTNFLDGFDKVSEFIQQYLRHTPFGPSSEVMDAYLFSREREKWHLRHKNGRLFITGAFRSKRTQLGFKDVPYWAGGWAILAALAARSGKVYPEWLRRLKNLPRQTTALPHTLTPTRYQLGRVYL